LLAQLRSSKAIGRLVIDLPRVISEPLGSEDDVVLRNGDQLIVPRYQQEVTVIGEVQSVTSHLYRSELTRADYIALSGGMTIHADASKIYVVRANGSVVANTGGFFRINSDTVKIHPGDTIVVPLDTERLPPLPMWQAITQILYNIAVSVAAVHSLSL
jgi:polysaccharide export outer membrane protein